MKITPNISVQAALTALQEARPQVPNRALDPDDGGRKAAFDPDQAVKRAAPPADPDAVRKKPGEASPAAARRPDASESAGGIEAQTIRPTVAPAFQREAVGPLRGTAGPGLGLVVDIKV